VTTIPDSGPGSNGVFVSLWDIYQEQRAHGRALAEVQGDMTDVKDDVSELRSDVNAMKSRQLPAWFTAILGGVAVTVLGAVAAVWIK